MQQSKRSVPAVDTGASRLWQGVCTDKVYTGNTDTTQNTTES
jgi:hypothetical protein